MCRRFLLSIVGAGLTFVLVSTGWAQLPTDPPVPQTIGQVDTVADSLEEADCRICHDAAQGVPDRHHLLWGTAIPSGSVIPFEDADGDGTDDTNYSCLSCHDPDFNVVRDCTACHSDSPHHRTLAATDRQCTACHGDLVDDYDDGHYIPTYAPSLVTPFTGLWEDGYYDDGSPETQNLGTNTINKPEGIYPGTAGTPDTHASDANRLGLVMDIPGQDNNFIIDFGGRYDDDSFNVKVVHQAGPPSVSWAADASEAGELTIAFAPGVTTANAMVDAINDANGTPSENDFDADLDHSQGEGTGMFGPEHYEPEGGQPLNSRGHGAGGCNYCHDADDGAGLIIDNHDTHHGIELGIGTGSNVKAGTPDDPNPGGTWRKCNICHDYRDAPRGGSYGEDGGENFAMHIRICEECHGPESLHNIQADSPNANNVGTVVVGGEDAGYGHAGRDAGPGDSDCWGCHGFATASAALAGPLVPTIHNSDRQVITAGTSATVNLSGAAFTNTAADTTFTANVTLTSAGGDSVTLTPDAITDQQIQVTIPGDLASGNYDVQAVKVDGEEQVASNPTVISIVPKVTISTAKSAGKVTITGEGFGGYAKGSGTSVTRARSWGWGRWARTTAVEGKIISWSPTKIVADFGSAPKEVTVNSVFGDATAKATSTKPSGAAAARSATASFGSASAKAKKATGSKAKRRTRGGWWWW